jgi:23S rRNA (cytidine1920-2'-O)/16S rRNA (cytidine1409-2'-O)-methyltransferase
MPSMSAAAPRQRLDAEIVSRGLAPSRERAQALVASGLIEVDGKRARSVAQQVGAAAGIRLTGSDHPWASRGGLKLDAALTQFAIDCEGRVCLDSGASTGGFTDVLLSRGASLVYAVDVGKGQLIQRLAQDERVIVLDETNLRTLAALPGPAPQVITLDLAFISLRLVIPAVSRLAAPGADVISLYKPQFELGRDAVGRGGLVRDAALAQRGAVAFQEWLVATCDAVAPHAPVAAAVRGTKGNQEWLVHVRLPADAAAVR